MKKLEKYIINNLSTLFLSLFLSLFAIASIIFMIKLAAYTAIIQLSIFEMAKMYIFVIPELLFFTLPISFFVASALSIYKLSNDNEIVVLFSLGIHPKFIYKTLLKPALLLTFLMLFNFIFLFPHAKVMSDNFLASKKSEAKFNLSASEFGHKFGDWLLYIGKEDKNKVYYDVFLFNKNDSEEVLIKAKQAHIINKDGILKLKLLQGEGYSYSPDKFTQIDFEEMHINNSFKSNFTRYKSALAYWDTRGMKQRDKIKRNTLLIRNTLLSLFPVLCLFFVISISIVHARHQKSNIYLYLFIGLVIYYGATLGLKKYMLFYTIPVVSITWFFLTYYLYRKQIVARF